MNAMFFQLSLSSCGDEVNVWTAFPKTHATVQTTNPTTVQPISLVNREKLIVCVPDPRIPYFAYRILLPPGVDGKHSADINYF